MSKHESRLLPTWQYAARFTECVDYKEDVFGVVIQNGGNSKFTMAGKYTAVPLSFIHSLTFPAFRRVCSNCVPMATFKLDPHEYLTLAPGSQRAENELFLNGLCNRGVEAPRAGDESPESLCCIKRAKQMAINHLKLFTFASYVSAPPRPIPTAAIQPLFRKRVPTSTSLLFLDNRRRLEQQ